MNEAAKTKSARGQAHSTTLRAVPVGICAPSEKYFLAYQRQWIEDKSRLRICEKGRQIGLSYADSFDSVQKAAPKEGKDVWVMSRDEAQAKQYILYCKKWAQLLKRPFQDVGEQLFPVSGDAVKVQVITFASGHSIYALSSNPDAIVGKTGHVKLDEFALHKDQRQLYAVAKPVIQWGGTLSVISTHRGVTTVFNEIIRDIKERENRMGWSLHTIPIQRAVEAGIVERIDRATGGMWTRQWEESGKVRDEVELVPTTLREFWLAQQRAECLDEEQWQQEYCCVPADEASAFIGYDLIEGCTESVSPLRDWEYLAAVDPKLSQLYVGMDVARRRDLCVLDVGEKVGDVTWDRMRIEMLNRPFSEIRETLYRILRLPALRRACLDEGGLGMQLAEEAKAAFGWKVEAVTFTQAVKEDLGFRLRGRFEDRKLRLPFDEKLRADLHGVRKETTAAGKIRLEGETEDSHCDRFWAKALREMAGQANSMANFRAELLM